MASQMPTPQISEIGFSGLFDTLYSRVHTAKAMINAGPELDEVNLYIEKTRKILRLLEERRNTASPINRMPAEILTSIFDALQDHYKFDDLFPPATPIELDNAHSWMVITHVCRHWRNVALSTPTLWKNLHTRAITGLPPRSGWNHEIPISLIRRSSPASLRLSCTVEVMSRGPDEVPQVFYDALEEHVERMESFHLTSFPTIDQDLLNILDIPLPRLRSLYLRVLPERKLAPRDPETGVITWESYSDEVELRRILGGTSSSLRRFSLWDYTCWPGTAFPSLTHLSLHDQLTTPTLDEFFDTLQALPCLEVLHLERAGPEIPKIMSTLPTRRIALPNLREARFLVFDPNPMNFQHRILECVTTSSFVQIVYSLPKSDPDDLRWLLPGFPCCDNVTDIQFLPSLEDNPCAAVHLHSENQLRIQTNWEAIALYLPSLGAQFPHLTHILYSLADMPWYRSAQFRSLHNLTTLTICGSPDFNDVGFLLELLEVGDRPSMHVDVPCPKLSRVILYAVGLDPNDYVGSSWVLAKKLVENQVEVIRRKHDKDFEVHLVSEKNEVTPLEIRWTRRC
ncbi:hypothetical protein M413DRAFT_28251 [Hebeloma cylindrosporum]|uniref:Uncharacterized protein n=1 Tax=Hebeloma cylindrosporum TaxID=76867 RepID=A0A0C3CAF7_HEBCY|nr:hypothetical protein M413DRAFT_28251 [Hebeloma cylindrosporum h7]